jgi:hypothetical protein
MRFQDLKIHDRVYLKRNINGWSKGVRGFIFDKKRDNYGEIYKVIVMWDDGWSQSYCDPRTLFKFVEVIPKYEIQT